MCQKSNTKLIYIIEDDKVLSKALTCLIHSEGFKARCFYRGLDFLSAIKKNQYNPGCIILDVRLPDMNGLDVQEELKKLAFNSPIIFISGHSNARLEDRAIKAGCFDFITKPFNNQYLLEKVHQAVKTLP